MSIQDKKLPSSINLHLTQRCNYHCCFCFADYGRCSKELSSTEWKKIICELKANGCKKINFAGGEPTLYSELSELIKFSSDLGFYTSLISNGTGINNNFLKINAPYLDLM